MINNNQLLDVTSSLDAAHRTVFNSPSKPEKKNKLLQSFQDDKSSLKKKLAGPKITINLFNTEYPVIEEAAKQLGFKVKMNDPYI
jgi:hypothetical protein